MGFEDYLVYLSRTELSKPVTGRRLALDLVNKWSEIHFDQGSVQQRECPDSPGQIYLCFDAPEHLFEILIVDRGGVFISMRFALCNPTTIDKDFCQVVTWLMEKYGFEVSLARDLDPELPDEPDATLDPAAFERLYQKSIHYNRRLWQLDAGPVGEWKFRPEEAVYELFLKPRGLV